MAWITDEVMANYPPPEYLIEDVLVAGTASALVSAPGIGKTFVALDMAFAVASGSPWHGFKVQQSSVVYILAEGLGGLRQRVLAWRLDRKIPPGVPVGVWFWDAAVQLASFPNRLQFMDELAKVTPKPRFIIVDTLARCFVGRDENAAGEMGEFVQGIDVLRGSGATVLVLHHEGHTPGRERGSTALRGAVDGMMILARSPDRTGGLVLSSLKQREGELWEPIELQMRQVELPDETTSVVLSDAPPNTVLALPDKWAAAVTLLTTKFPTTSHPNGPTSKEWKTATDMSKATFHRMRREVINRGIVVQDGEHFRIRKVEG